MISNCSSFRKKLRLVVLDYWIPKNFRIQITVKIQKFINGCLLRERTMLFNSCYYISIAFKNIFHELLILLTAIGNSSVVAYRTYNQEVMGSSLRTAIIIFLGQGKKNDCETYVSHIQIIIKLVKYFGFRRG